MVILKIKDWLNHKPQFRFAKSNEIDDVEVAIRFKDGAIFCSEVGYTFLPGDKKYPDALYITKFHEDLIHVDFCVEDMSKNQWSSSHGMYFGTCEIDDIQRIPSDSGNHLFMRIEFVKGHDIIMK